MRVGEPCEFRADEEVAVERDLEAARDRNAVDRADQRLDVRWKRTAERRAAVADRGEALTLLHLAAAELLQVDARTERRIAAGEDHHVDRVVVVATRDGGGQGAPHSSVQRVALVGPVQRDGGDPIGDVDEDDARALVPWHQLPRKSNAILIAPLSSWVASAANASRQSSRRKVWVSIPVKSTRPSAAKSR